MTQEWLTLKDAAERLGVHPSTLRRWADAGNIPYMLTPGGHRRFLRQEVETFAQRRQKGGQLAPSNRGWMQQALLETRTGMAASSDQRWIAAFNEEKRMEQRELGRRLMGLLLQYVSNGTSDSEEMLVEAREIGQTSGRNSQQIGLSLTEALEATMFFRDSVVESAIQLPKSTRARTVDNIRLLRRINRFMNVVQLAIAEAYDDSHLSGT